MRISTQKGVSAAPVGRHHAGPGLYLLVFATSRRWAFRYTKPETGRVTEFGLGSAEFLTLKEAREKVHEHRRTVAQGEDPVELRRNHRRAGITFAEMAAAFITIKQPTWRSEKHYDAMRQLLQQYASPLATKHISAIASDDVEAAVRTAPQRKRTLSAIRQVFDLAISKGHCTSNPADGRIMKYRFPTASTVQHFKAMDYHEMPDLVQRLRVKQQQGVFSPCVIEFLILTACRVNEVTQMQWFEVNLQTKTWSIPATRTKTGREHRVPLSDRAMVLLDQQETHAVNFVWSSRHGKPVTNKALYLYLTRGMKLPVTLHGFRSTFRNWLAEKTDFDFHLAEMCLAHVPDATVRAYLRGDGLEKRREIMTMWADYCSQPNVLMDTDHQDK